MPTFSTVGQLLSQFPGPLTLYPSRKKWLLIFAGGALFAASGVFMIRGGDPKGWFVLIFFSLAPIAAAVKLLPKASALRLDREGFEATSLFRRQRTRWTDTAGFTVYRLPQGGNRLVVYDDLSQSAKSLAKISKGLTGRNSAVADTYGLSAEEFAMLMAEWRERAIARAAKAAS